MVSQTDLEAAIRQKVNNVSALVVSDVSGGCGQAYDVIIVSDVFDGLSTLKRHRMVNELLKEQIAELHAFSQKTYTPQQYEQLSSSGTATPAAAETASSATTTQPPATSAAASSLNTTPAMSNSGATLGAGLSPGRPSTLDTSVAQRGSKVHHRSTSSSVSVPELVLTPDAADAKRPGGGAGAGSHGRQRSLTPNAIEEMIGAASSSQGAGGQGASGSGISRLHYGQITNVEFWTELRDFLDRRFKSAAAAAADETSGSASPSPLPGRVKGETEAVKVWEEWFNTQKAHMSASDVARVRDGTGMLGM